ncbi:MAG TPA: hypothetical protein VFN20_11695 [Candidatus Acidoferrum sp.]|nr:hypothetical protein [Candidatus Acidoferrum sp.]
MKSAARCKPACVLLGFAIDRVSLVAELDFLWRKFERGRVAVSEAANPRTSTLNGNLIVSQSQNETLLLITLRRWPVEQVKRLSVRPGE